MKTTMKSNYYNYALSLSLILSMLALNACSDNSTGVVEEEEEEETIQPEESNWAALSTGTNSNLNDVYFIDEKHWMGCWNQCTSKDRGRPVKTGRSGRTFLTIFGRSLL